MASDEIEKHLLKCFSKTHLTYNSRFSDVPTVMLKASKQQRSRSLKIKAKLSLGSCKTKQQCEMQEIQWHTFVYSKTNKLIYILKP